MKRILVLLSLFALVSGAWAAEGVQKYKYQYRFEVACPNVAGSHIFPEDTIAMLVDTREQEGKYKVLAYTSMSEVGTPVYLDHTELATDIPSDAFVNQNHQIMAVELTDNPNVVGNTRYVDLLVTLRSDTALGSEYLGQDRHEGKAHDLAVVIFSKNSGRYQTLSDLTWSTEMSVGTTANFSPVPEPTSGLLLLLGVAGLALKRKKKAA